ncbi:MAG: lipopolysaccharide biosynthesis protein [Clostridiales bacterium]|nr:lipopolysaccharide biosynthesis protein [Clostridiales bacterium]
MDNRSITRDTMLFLPAKILEGLVGILTLSYISHAITTGGVDTFGSVNTIVSFSYLLLISYLTNSAARYVAEETREDERRRSFFSTCSLIWVFTNILVYILVIPLKAFGVKHVAAVACMFTANSLYQLTLSMLVQVGKKKESIALSLISAILKPALIFTACHIMGSGQQDTALPAIASFVAAELLCGIIGVFLLRIPRNFSFKAYSGSLAAKLFRYGIPLMGVSLSVGLLNVVDRFVIIFFGEDFAVYYTNNTISSSVFTMLMIGIMRAVYPSILKAYREEGFERAQSVVDGSVRMYLLVAMPACAGLIGISRSLSALLFEESYVWGHPIIALSAVAMFFTGFTEYAIKAWELRGDTKPIMQNALISVVVKVVCTVMLLPVLGVFGAGVSSIISFSLYFVISSLRAKKIFLFRLPLKRLLSILIPSLLCMAVSYIVSTAVPGRLLGVALSVFAGIAIYGLALALSGEVKQEISMIKGKLSKFKDK